MVVPTCSVTLAVRAAGQSTVVAEVSRLLQDPLGMAAVPVPSDPSATSGDVAVNLGAGVVHSPSHSSLWPSQHILLILFHLSSPSVEAEVRHDLQQVYTQGGTICMQNLLGSIHILRPTE